MRISRRKFLWSSASAAGVGLALDSTLSKPLQASDDNCRVCQVQPQPIPHTIATPFGTTIHHFFPGPVEGGVNPDTGHDPSEIFDFGGIVAQTDLLLTGTGTDLNTGNGAPYNFHTDVRFMAGKFRGADGETHEGTFGFI